MSLRFTEMYYRFALHPRSAARYLRFFSNGTLESYPLFHMLFFIPHYIYIFSLFEKKKRKEIT